VPATLLGNNTTWQIYTTTFTAAQNGTPLQIAGLEPGMLLDGFALTGVASNLYYLPEQDMSAVNGTSAQGCWTLEIQDDRAGATNNAVLQSWQLGFTFANTNFIPGLTGGQPLTNTVCSNSIAWYQVNVPTNAIAATNILLFATAPVNVWYSANHPPTTNNPGDVVLIPNSTGPASAILTPTTLPALVPGGSYFLGVQDTSGSCTTYAIEVDFAMLEIPVFTNNVPQTNTVCSNSVAWYQVNVPTNAIAATNTLLFATAPVNVWYSANFPPTTNNPGDVVLIPNSIGPVSVVLTPTTVPALVPGGTYYLGVQDTSGGCTTYAIEVDFDLVTNIPPPFAFTQPAYAVTGTGARLNGMATPNLLPATAWFQWGTSTLYGNQTPPVSVGTGSNVVYTTSLISGLAPNVPYHFRLVVSNAVTVVYGFDQILDEANVVVWGANYAGQLKLPPGLSNVVAIAGAYDHGLALKTNETAVAWGDNLYGEATVPAGLNNLLAVAGGESFSLALQSNGTVTAWGSDIYPGAGETNVPAGLNNVVMIASGQYSSLALQSDGAVTAWGANLFNPTNIPAGLSNVVSIAGGTLHNLAIKNDGTVVAWGDNGAGQTNVPANLTNVVAIAAGSFHSLALKSDGTVVAWGFDSAGQTDVPTNLADVVAIAAGGFHSLALKADGTVVGWGDDTAGQLNVPTGLTNMVAIASGYLYSLALTPQSIVNLTNVIVNTTNGVPQTNNILGGSITWYQINVPTNADFATNQLLFALQGPLNIWFDTNNLPTTNVFLFSGTNGSYTLSTTSAPPLVPGSTYYLGVQNTNGFSVTYGIEVDFHLVPPPGPILISSITPTNIGGTFGFLLTWYAPTNDLFMVQWARGITPPLSWNTFTNIITYTSLTPTNGIGFFEFFDDGSQTGGFDPFRFYRLLLLTGPAPGAPQTNSVPPGGMVNFFISVPTNADFATNTLLTATGPVNLWFNHLAPTTGTNAGDYLLLGGATNGAAILSTSSAPTNIVPGGFYWLGVQNTNSFSVTVSLVVNFHLQAPTNNPILIAGITYTNIGGTNGFLLTWLAPTNDVFQVEWEDALLPENWQFFANFVYYTGPVTPTNGWFSYFDDGSQTPPGLPLLRFYRIVLVGTIPSTHTNAVLISGVTATNLAGTNGIWLAWTAPTNYLFEVQWTTNLVAVMTWQTVPDIVAYSTFVSPTNSLFDFFDDGSLTVPLGTTRFYRLIILP